MQVWYINPSIIIFCVHTQILFLFRKMVIHMQYFLKVFCLLIYLLICLVFVQSCLYLRDYFWTGASSLIVWLTDWHVCWTCRIWYVCNFNHLNVHLTFISSTLPIIVPNRIAVWWKHKYASFAEYLYLLYSLNPWLLQGTLAVQQVHLCEP